MFYYIFSYIVHLTLQNWMRRNECDWFFFSHCVAITSSVAILILEVVVSFPPLCSALSGHRTLDDTCNAELWPSVQIYNGTWWHRQPQLEFISYSNCIFAPAWVYSLFNLYFCSSWSLLVVQHLFLLQLEYISCSTSISVPTRVYYLFNLYFCSSNVPLSTPSSICDDHQMVRECSK